MNVTEVAALSSLAVSLLSVLSIFYFVGVKLATLQVKVDTMWEFALRRGKSEAIMAGLATMNSPIEVTAKAKALLEPLMPELRGLYEKVGSKLSEADLALQIERQYGQRILEDLCIPNHMHMGACLVIILKTLQDEYPRMYN